MSNPGNLMNTTSQSRLKHIQKKGVKMKLISGSFFYGFYQTNSHTILSTILFFKLFSAYAGQSDNKTVRVMSNKGFRYFCIGFTTYSFFLRIARKGNANISKIF